MTTTPIQRLAELVVGTVESVAPNEVYVLLDLEAPHATALNTGTPQPFPRLNGYILLPNEAGATVGYVSWMGIERSPYPKRSGLKDFGLIDLPFPLRKMCITPIGTLTSKRDAKTGNVRFELRRGVVSFPSVGDQVLVPTAEQIAAIVGAGDKDRRVRIGVSPLASNATIVVDPDKLFGRHLAVLGNTGSGKSCSVAGLIRWSLDASQNAIARAGKSNKPNTRFIVLDPNGEYSRAFSDLGDGVRLFKVPPVSTGERPLDVPAWMWNGHEWTAVAQAQPGAQRPLLFQGLRELKSGRAEGIPREAVIRRYLVSYMHRINRFLGAGTSAFAETARARFDCARALQAIFQDLVVLSDSVEEPLKAHMLEVVRVAKSVIAARKDGNYFHDFLASDLESVRDALQDAAADLPDITTVAPISEDAPLHFDVTLLADHLERIASDQGGALAGFISTLGIRIRGMLADQRLGAVIGRDPPTTFEAWLNDYIGANEGANGPVSIIDLSLVPAEIVHVVVAVLARLVFEALQRYRRLNSDGKALPTVLVLEEAHTFIKKGSEGPAASADHLCRETFERIAREGRKFGLGLVLSSQRPSELSATVLAQCNTFLLHRLVNDSDQNLVSRLVPDNVGGLLRELPSLASRQAILLGWATPIPVLVEIDELPEEHRPHSADPDFWDVWTLAKPRVIDWSSVTDEWSRSPEPPAGFDEEPEGDTA
ncbi:ATP-binding protein [Bradyrhizobium japonicum]|uniref:ATP-binding protein n=1 Tax=Bradyrhizobium japonicum TaxID=375 RepID=UPI003513F45E